jgi:hypothetical protein
MQNRQEVTRLIHQRHVDVDIVEGRCELLAREVEERCVGLGWKRQKHKQSRSEVRV